jgi:AcrR family transcriptional regulator
VARNKTPQQADKILAAASQLFATHRFHEARMEDIAAAAEVGKGTLYRYFKDKEELYLALLEHAAQGLLERLECTLSGIQGAREQLEAVASALISYFDENPHLFDLIQHAEAMQKPGATFPWQKPRTETMNRVRAVFNHAASEGEFVVDDPEMALLFFLGGLRALLRFTHPPRDPDLPSRIVRSFLHGHARVADVPCPDSPWPGRLESLPADSTLV